MNRPLTATILVLSTIIVLVMGYWLAELFLYFANKLFALMSMNLYH